MFLPFTLREGAHHVHVDEGESFVRNLDLSHSWVDCPGLLGQLTRVTALDEFGDFFAQAWPLVIVCHPPGGLLDSRMVQVMLCARE